MFGYQQSDLMPEELVLFDAYQMVYAWVGKLYSEKNPKVILETVEEYLVMGKILLFCLKIVDVLKQ